MGSFAIEIQSQEKFGAAGPCRHKPLEERCFTCILDSSEYFHGLPIETKLELQKGLRRREYGRREKLYFEGEKGQYIYILVSGEVKVYKSLSNGRQQIHKIASIPGDLIGCEDMFLEAASSTAEAIDTTSVCCLKTSFLLNTMAGHAELSNVLMRAMSRNLNAYIRHIANLGGKNALARVASYLYYLHETHRERGSLLDMLPASLSRVELADMLSITQRTLIRSLKSLEGEGIISIAREGFVIADVEGLVRIADAD